MAILSALEFPPISHLVEWKSWFGGDSWYAFNKIAFINVLAVVCTAALFFIAASKKQLVPTGVRNVVEASIDFVDKGIVHEVMGHHGKPYVPFLTSMFFFIFFNNIFGIIPFIQMPATARMAVPAFLALLTWVVFNVAGIKAQGAGHYFKGALFPPGVPKALYILVTPIELISTFLVRPFSLAVRLFANVLAGHILLVSFAVLTQTLWAADLVALKPVFVLPLFMLIFLTGFEVLVAFLQAYIFTILAAVYIGGAVHPEH